MSAAILMFACGVCLQDKVAATYDYGIVTKAVAQHRVVVFAEPRAAVDPMRLQKSLAAAAAHVPGVDAATVRTNASPASLSFALDPKRGDPRQALAAIRKASGIPGLEIDLLEVVATLR